MCIRDRCNRLVGWKQGKFILNLLKSMSVITLFEGNSGIVQKVGQRRGCRPGLRGLGGWLKGKINTNRSFGPVVY